MGLFGKGNVVNLIHMEGLPNFKDGFGTSMKLDEENKSLLFHSRVVEVPDVNLPIEKITRAGFINVEELEEQSKLGRAVVGGFLFGGVGAIVGALSAGEKKKIKTLYVINYISNGEEHDLVFKDLGGNFNFSKLQDRINELIPKEESNGPVTL